MNIIHHPKRYLLDIAVGVVLISMLSFGSVAIYRLNDDARDLQFNSALAMQGQQYSTDLGCVACHTVDGSPGVGPSWVDMWGRTEQLNRDRTAVVDEEYFRESLQEPGAKVVVNFPNVMGRYFLSEPEITALIEYVKQLDSVKP
ncbi:MAG: cytochrome c [Pseudomonadota bacterium]